MTGYNVQFPSLGLNFHINPVAFSIGDFNVYWYGIIIGCGFLLALLYALKSLKRFSIDRDGFFDCVLVGLICGIIGARAYYVLFKLDYYIANPSEILAIHNGGLAIYGGVIGGLLGGCIVAKIKKISIPAILDVAVLGFLIGQGIGRWGNFINQEAFGTPTNLPWGMLSENTNGDTVHPCFLYESLWCILGFFVLNYISKKHRKYDGQIFLMYLIWYGFERMIVEGLRTDSLYLPFLNLRVSQILAAATMLVGIILLIVFRNRTVKAADTYNDKAAKPDKKTASPTETPKATTETTTNETPTDENKTSANDESGIQNEKQEQKPENYKE